MRATPGASGAALGFVRRGRSLPWGGRSVGGWHAALYRGGVAWVSARFATVEKA